MKWIRYGQIVANLAMITGLVLLMLSVVGWSDADAADWPATIASGRVVVRVQAGPANPDADATLSISVRQGDVQVFCADIAPGETVLGETDSITNTPGSPVLLVAYAHSMAGCTGTESLPSDDRYTVIFAAPSKPLLLPPTP